MQNDDLTSVALQQLIAADNWQAKYRLITDWGKLISVKPELRTAQNVVKGCETSAWLVHQCNHARHQFLFDSESRVMNGLAALLLSIINNKTHQELTQLHFADILHDAGLQKHLTPSRNNGFNTIIARAKELANTHSCQDEYD